MLFFIFNVNRIEICVYAFQYMILILFIIFKYVYIWYYLELLIEIKDLISSNHFEKVLFDHISKVYGIDSAHSYN